MDSTIFDYFVKVLNVLLGLLTIYLYLENKKLKGFESEKKKKIKEIELKQLEYDKAIEKRKIHADMTTRGFGNSTIYDQNMTELEYQFNLKEDLVKAEIDYYNKLLKYKWLLSE